MSSTCTGMARSNHAFAPAASVAFVSKSARVSRSHRMARSRLRPLAIALAGSAPPTSEAMPAAVARPVPPVARRSRARSRTAGVSMSTPSAAHTTPVAAISGNTGSVPKPTVSAAGTMSTPSASAAPSTCSPCVRQMRSTCRRVSSGSSQRGPAAPAGPRRAPTTQRARPTANELPVTSAIEAVARLLSATYTRGEPRHVPAPLARSCATAMRTKRLTYTHSNSAKIAAAAAAAGPLVVGSANRMSGYEPTATISPTQ